MDPIYGMVVVLGRVSTVLTWFCVVFRVLVAVSTVCIVAEATGCPIEVEWLYQMCVLFWIVQQFVQTSQSYTQHPIEFPMDMCILMMLCHVLVRTITNHRVAQIAISGLAISMGVERLIIPD